MLPWWRGLGAAGEPVLFAVAYAGLLVLVAVLAKGRQTPLFHLLLWQAKGQRFGAGIHAATKVGE